MAKKKIHVTPHPKGGWQTKKDGGDRATSKHDRKEDALKHGRDQAKREKAELVIHGRDGKIQDSDSYGNDPCPPKDEKH